MPEPRIYVWVQEFQDRDNLVLQWHDPDSGKRKSKSAKTSDPDEAERARAVGVKSSMNTLRKGFGCRYPGKVPAILKEQIAANPRSPQKGK